MPRQSTPLTDDVAARRVDAHGHPIGATGPILTTHLMHSMKHDGLRRGMVALCIVGGQGIALAVEMMG
jgi:acetyl-CoA C-acetyltransferase